MTLLWLIGVPVAVSVLSALITSLMVERQKSKRDLALRKIDEFLTFSRTEGEAFAILKGPRTALTAEQQLTLWRVGDWFEVLALLLSQDQLNADLIRGAGLDQNAREYHAAYRSLLKGLTGNQQEAARTHFEQWRSLNDLATRG